MKATLPMGELYSRTKNTVEKNQLHTICKSGLCPNIGECWGKGTASFMILGDICTRNCRFCGVETGKPNEVDCNEPLRLANSIKLMKLNHAVITSVTRDDLEDEGSIIWAQTIREVKRINPEIKLEVLIPDFSCRHNLIDRIINEKPHLISHNLETVERLTPAVRNKALYQRSLLVLKYIAEQGTRTKSGIMLGLGETSDEIYCTMDDLRSVNCSVLTIGQYLQPNKECAKVQEYISPETFLKLKHIALDKGFDKVESGPLVRSSFHAENHI